MTDDGLALRFAAAEAVAREAGQLGLRHFREVGKLTIERKGLQDFVSRADHEVEALIRARLTELFPGDGFLGEESGRADSGPDGGIWVVDPIDGTACFVAGIPDWCISIAWVRGGAIEIGAIYVPVLDDLFMARRGGGATLNGRPIAVSNARTLTDGVMGVGFSFRSQVQAFAPVLTELLEHGGMFYRNGSGALMLAYVAAGRLIGYFEPHINSWDSLAGLLLIREAGGRTNDFLADDGLYSGNMVVAAAPGVADDVSALAGVDLLP